MGIKRKQHSAEFKARVAMAALSGEKTLAELSAEFGVHPTMISDWKQELGKRAGELFARGNRAPAVGDAQKVIDDLHRKIGQLRSSAIFLPGSPPSPECCEAGDDCAGGGAVRKPAMHAAGDWAQQLLLPAAAGIGGGTRASEAARPDFHRLSSLRQPPAPGGAVARGDFDGPPARPAADEKARAVGGQTEAEYQQAASRAQGLPIPPARQDNRPGEPSVGCRHNLHTNAAGIFVPGRYHRLGDPAGAVLAAVKHAHGGVLRRGTERGSRPVRQARHLQYRSKPALAKAGGAQFTSDEFTKMLTDHGIAISMDGRGRCHDNIFVERLWWTVKHEWVYLRPAANGIEQKRSLGEFLDWYNLRRPHQALGWRTPDEAYLGQSTAATALAA